MKFSDMVTDVLIVGAGPAGLSLAINLGKRFIPSILIDQKPRKEIGYKPCGDLLAPASTRRLFELSGINRPRGEEIAENLDSAYFRPSENFEFQFPFPSMAIDRLKYGQRLLKSLTDYPWIKVYSRYKTIEALIKNDKVIGCKIRKSDGKYVNIYAKIVADCSGVIGIVRRNLNPKVTSKIPTKIQKHETIISYREIIKTKTKHPYQKQMRIEARDELPPPGYFWIFSKGIKTLNVGTGWLINDQNKHINVKKSLIKLRKKFFPDAEVIDGAGDTLTGRLPLYSMVANGFITCGDAAALVNPISGEGHGPALLSAFYASVVIEKAIREQRSDERALWEYNIKIWNLYGYDGGLGVAVQKLLNAIPFSEFSFLFEKGIITQKDVDAIMDSYNAKIPVIGKAIKLFQKPKMLIKVIKTLYLAERIKKLAQKYPEDPDYFAKWQKKIMRLEKKKI